MCVRAFVAAAALILTTSPPSRADVIFTFSGGTAEWGQHFTYGFQFTPVVDITVNSLGLFDVDQDGLAVGAAAVGHGIAKVDAP
jgi:hypothetical protein